MKRRSSGAAILLLLLGPVAFPQVKTEVRNLTELLMPAGGTYPLPENAVELESRLTIPLEKGAFSSRLKVDRTGSIYAVDERSGTVLVFDPEGKAWRRFETRGRSAGKAANPPVLDPDETLVFQDIEARDLLFFDLAGRRLRKTSIPPLHDFVLDREGRLFAAPVVLAKSDPVVEVYDPKGKRLRRFGQALSFSHSLGMLNARRLAVMPTGEVAVAFVYLPVLRLYSGGGDLLVEYAVENEIIKAKEAINLKTIGEGIANPGRRGLCVKILYAVRMLGESVFLLSNYPRLEILEMDKGGKVTATYWKDFDEVMMPEDFAVAETAGARLFYVLRSLPSYGIDVYSAAPNIYQPVPRGRRVPKRGPPHPGPRASRSIASRGQTTGW